MTLLLQIETTEAKFKDIQHITDTDAGGWGPWSDWTPCSTTCAGGTKNRYRVCDSPPPRYGAKFCKVIIEFAVKVAKLNYYVCKYETFKFCSGRVMP